MNPNYKAQVAHLEKELNLSKSVNTGLRADNEKLRQNNVSLDRQNESLDASLTNAETDRDHARAYAAFATVCLGIAVLVAVFK